MLNVDLVRIAYRENSIIPKYIDTEKKAFLETAENLLEIYENHQGKTRGDLKNCLDDFLQDSPNIIIYRGLCKLLEDRCEFTSNQNLDPIELRKETFEISSQLHRQKTYDRGIVLEKVAEKFNTSVAEIENALFSDLRDNQVIESCKTVLPGNLLKIYNTSLAQAILLKAGSLEIRIQETNPLRYRQLFRAIKFHRLLYCIEGNVENGFIITLDGPMSIFRSCQKYGLQMALFLPALLLCENWSLTAEVNWGRRNQKKRFCLSSKDKLYSHYPDVGMYQPPEWKTFSERFTALDNQWQISSDCDFFSLDTQEICIPDYSFTHSDGTIIFLEIFGFWRKGALQKRIKTMQQKNSHLILAVSKKLNVDSQTEKNLVEEIYYFHEVLNPKKVTDCLNQKYESLQNESFK